MYLRCIHRLLIIMISCCTIIQCKSNDSSHSAFMVKSSVAMICPSFILYLNQILWIRFAICDVYHIIPSPDHHCTVEPCLTLSVFTANASLYLDNNTSLIFQPGNHTIHLKLNVSGVTSFSMISNQSRAGIVCENDSEPGFTFNAVNHVHISNLKFLECYYHYTFDDGNKLITLTASSLVVVKCIFENNVGTGFITAINSNITIAQSTFQDNNDSENIGSNNEIIELIYCNTTVISSIFINNDGPKVLYVRNNEIGYDSKKGSIITMSNTLTVTGCEFRNNSYYDYYNLYEPPSNGIITVHNSDIHVPVLSIYDTEFINNEADSILYANESVLSTDNCIFKYNRGITMDLDKCKADIFNSVLATIKQVQPILVQH